MTSLALAMLLAGAPADTVVVDACPGARALSQAELDGTILVSDLLLRLGVAWTSTDGFDMRPAGGAAPSGATPWVVLIDGVPLETGPFGAAEMHLLPVQPWEIERVVHCPGPAIAAGRFAGSGVLSITTRSPSTWVGEASARIANESGDPGPRRYLSDAAPNVDKIGPDVAGGAATRQWSIAGRFERRYPSDPYAFERNAAALGAYPAVRYGAASVSGGRPGGALRFNGAGTYASDLWMVEPAGRELPVRRVGAQGALTGGRTLGRLAAGARLAATWVRIERRPESPDSALAGFDPDWRELGATLDLELRRPHPRRALAAGAHVSAFGAAGPGLFDGSGGLLRIWASRMGDPRARWRRRSDVAVVSDGEHTGLEAAASVQRILDGGSISVTAARDDRVPGESRGLAYWAARGFAGMETPAVRYTPAQFVDRATEWSMRVDGALDAGRGGALRASIGGRDFRGLTLDEASFRPDSTEFVTGEAASTGGHHGSVLLASAALALDAGRVAWTVAYRFERAVAGDPAFRDAWRTVPEHIGTAGATVRPDPSLLVRLEARARSGVRWPSHSAFDGAPVPGGEGSYSAAVPGAVVVDLDLRKTVLGGRAVLAASARNLLNVVDRTHPLGATLAFRLWVSATFRLSSRGAQAPATSPF